MSKRYLVLAVLMGALFALILKLPLGWVAPPFMPKEAGKNLRYSGTVWNGQISGIDYFGRAQFKLSPKALLKGALPMSFKTSSPAMSVSGEASPRKIKDLRFLGQLAQLPTRDGRLKGLAGQVNFTISQMDFGRSCKAASGRANTDFLARNRARWQWAGPALSGPISCEGGDLIVNLAGTEDDQTIRADLRLSPNGSYSADISVITRKPEAGVVLPLYGFTTVNGEFRLTERGQWR